MASDKKTVLVIDDEPDVVTFITTVLQDHGYATMTARDGKEALEQVRARRPDLITLDVTMPERSGVRFYRDMKLAPETKAIPIVIITGVSEDFQGFISSRRRVPPPEGYISKPLSPEELVATVGKLLA